MKTILLFAVISVFIFCSCHKDHDKAAIDYCSGLVTDTATGNDTARIFMPNAFTPGSDGLNDILRPVLKGAASFTFELLDDNGGQVFSSDAPWQGFAPATAPSTYTTYHYRIQVTTNQGHQLSECGVAYALSCIPSNWSVVLNFEDELTQNGFHTGTTLENIPTCP